MSGTLKAERELTGRHVLIMLLIFFGLIIGSSIWFTTLAVTSFRGEDVEKSYRQGLDYNHTLAEREAQAALGWAASVNTVGTPDDRMLVVRLDAGDRKLFGLEVTGKLRHPVDTDLDRNLAFQPGPDGTLRADLSGLIGQWVLQAQATDGRDDFRFAYTLDLR
ncbi:MAG: FixH family protein [Pseudomonadota bacterium]